LPTDKFFFLVDVGHLIDVILHFLDQGVNRGVGVLHHEIIGKSGLDLVDLVGHEIDVLDKLFFSFT
jgi:hypothetical protein